VAYVPAEQEAQMEAEVVREKLPAGQDVHVNAVLAE
jgi:hypothetical protein